MQSENTKNESKRCWFYAIAGLISAAVVAAIITICVLYAGSKSKSSDNQDPSWPPADMTNIFGKAKFLSPDANSGSFNLLELQATQDTPNLHIKELPVQMDLDSFSYQEDGIEVVKLSDSLLQKLGKAKQVARNQNGAPISIETYQSMLHSLPPARKKLEDMIQQKTSASQVKCMLGGTNFRNSQLNKALRFWHMDLEDAKDISVFETCDDVVLDRQKLLEYIRRENKLPTCSLPFVADELVNVWMHIDDKEMRNYHLGFIQKKFIRQIKKWDLGVPAGSLSADDLKQNAYISIPKNIKWGEALMFRSAGPKGTVPVHAALQTRFGKDEYKNYERISMEFRCAVKY